MNIAIPGTDKVDEVLKYAGMFSMPRIIEPPVGFDYKNDVVDVRLNGGTFLLVEMMMLLIFQLFPRLPRDISRKIFIVGSGLMLMALEYDREPFAAPARGAVYLTGMGSILMMWAARIGFMKRTRIASFRMFEDIGITVYLVVVLFWFFFELPPAVLAPMFLVDTSDVVDPVLRKIGSTIDPLSRLLDKHGKTVAVIVTTIVTLLVLYPGMSPVILIALTGLGTIAEKIGESVGQSVGRNNYGNFCYTSAVVGGYYVFADSAQSSKFYRNQAVASRLYANPQLVVVATSITTAAVILGFKLIRTRNKAIQNRPPNWSSSPMPRQGWRVESVSSEEQRTLQKFLRVSHPDWLLIGGDIKETTGHKNLQLVHAWRIENDNIWAKYVAGRDEVLAQRDGQIKRIPQETTLFDRLHHEMPGASVDKSINEKFLLHGTKPESLLPILATGLKDRFGHGLFGDAVYSAEEPEKIDQYCTSTMNSTTRENLKDQLKGGPDIGGGDRIYFCFILRVVLGFPTKTKDAQKNLEDGGSVWLIPGNRRVLSNIPQRHLSDPKATIEFHSLIAEIGGVVKRNREFMVFDGDRIYPEYLLAYRRVV